MNTSRTIVCSGMLAGLLAQGAFAQPQEWNDDFTTVATYDSASMIACLYGGPPTKYTVIGFVSGDIFNQRALSGDERLLFTNRQLPSKSMRDDLGVPRIEYLLVGQVGFGIGCPGEPNFGVSNAPFTSENLCIYGGFSFNPWQLKTGARDGADGLPGVANTDDDGDGTTDWSAEDCLGFLTDRNEIDDDGDGTTDEDDELAPECDESPNSHPTAVGDGYGNRDGTGFWAPGQDGKPGTAGVDDDGNGTTDDVGETGWPGTDDSDDNHGRLTLGVFMISISPATLSNRASVCSSIPARASG